MRKQLLLILSSLILNTYQNTHAVKHAFHNTNRISLLNQCIAHYGNSLDRLKHIYYLPSRHALGGLLFFK